MDLQQLRYVAALARELHFGRAAKSVNVTQPTLSQQIQRLEREIGAPLFERSPREVRLTKAGKKFVPTAIAVLDRLREGVAGLREEQGVVSGTVRVGAIPTVCPYFLPEAIAALEKTHPNVRLEIYEETTSVLLESLKSGRLDVGLLALPIHDRGIATLGLHKEPFYAAMSKRHKLASKKVLGRKDLAGEKLLILQEGHCFGQQSLQFCKLRREDEQVSFQGSSLSSVMALAAAGRGVTFVPEMAMRRSQTPNLAFVPLEPSERPTREIGLAWRLSAAADRAQKAFMDACERLLAGAGTADVLPSKKSSHDEIRHPEPRRRRPEEFRREKTA